MTKKKPIDKRTKAYKELVLRMPKTDGVITEHIDGEDFQYIPEPRCRVCSADDPVKELKNGFVVKELVDRLIMYPMSVAGILRYIEPMMEDWPSKSRITARSIRGHHKNHLPWEDVATRYMVEKWAATKGISVLDAGERMILTEEAWLEKTAQLGWERLLAGEIEPNWLETQKSFERMQSIKEMAEGNYSITYLLSQLNKIISAVKDTVPPELWPVIQAKIDEPEQVVALPEASSDEFFEELVEEFIEPLETAEENDDEVVYIEAEAEILDNDREDE